VTLAYSHVIWKAVAGAYNGFSNVAGWCFHFAVISAASRFKIGTMEAKDITFGHKKQTGS
jgi:hypothetical protein